MQVLVVCRANVCRSRVGAGLLAAPLGALGAEVRSGGVVPAPPDVVCPEASAFLAAAGVSDVPGPRGVGRDDLAAADLVLPVSRDVSAALTELDLSVRPRMFLLRRAAATAQAVAAMLPEGPPGAPPLPPADDVAGRWAWFVEELDAGRGLVPLTPEEDGVPDPHVDEADHPTALAAVAQACEQLAAAASVVLRAP